MQRIIVEKRKRKMKLYLWMLVLSFWGCVSFHDFSKSYLSKRRVQSKLMLMQIKIGLTREKGANEKLQSLLSEFECLEIPCITFASTNERVKLTSEVSSHDLAIITSPQSASVFIDEIKYLPNYTALKVVAIGKGTSKPLKEAGIIPVFEPSDSLGETLAQQLPFSLGNKVLYPCSELAEDKIPSILRQKGFQVFLKIFSILCFTFEF